MFNSLLRDFDEDPFFSDPFQAHNERMRQMMRSFSEPFGHTPFTPSITEGRSQPHNSTALQEHHRGIDLRNPFSLMDNMMMGMRSRMDDMHRNFENSSSEPPSGHSFSSSSITTYSKVGNQPPKVFQAQSQTRRAPGGVRETRRSLKDSESGVEKMSIGHHIQDRGHLVEKKRNHKTGEREFNQDFQNMDESEAQAFDDEWQREVTKFQPVAPMSMLEAPPPHHTHHQQAQPRTVHRAAIAAPIDSRNPNAGGRQTHTREIKIQRPGLQEP
ncbi:myeloid leukemia factor 1 isoform X2 [Engraulis encrasicolus]|uniref:myeloid leukemia factor 1 isoform X2 n=1 Tax=Engraulis encrasicolus TaxID=184585 RepID=UPI002FD704B9